MIKNMKLAAIAKDGVPIKDDIKNISEIRPNIDEFSLSWLECVVDDVKIGSKEIAKEFGGGGHKKAAGFQLPIGAHIEDLFDKIPKRVLDDAGIIPNLIQDEEQNEKRSR